MKQLLTIALAQYPSGRDCTQIVVEAKAAAEIVVLPEMYSNGYARFHPKDPGARARWCAEAESRDGDFVGRFCEAARRHGVHVVATFLEKAEPKPFNAALLIDRGGRPPAFTADDIAAARALMSAGDLPVRAIAKRMGVSLATLYRHVGKRGHG
jgi:predicted amidohydrolase